MPDHKPDILLGLTANIVAAHLSYNELTAEQLPTLIQSVYLALATADAPEVELAITQAPAVPVKRSVFPDFIVCLEDGKKLKTLKRHLQTSYGMTPDDYRAKWGLPRDYPMVAPNYASIRAALAKQIGLGRRAVQRSTELKVTQLPARRARGSKT